MLFSFHYKAIKKITGLDAIEIIGDSNNWVATLTDGTQINQTDIDKEIIDNEIKQLAAEVEANAAATETAKAAATAKLAALGLTTDDLKALGLGGN